MKISILHKILVFLIVSITLILYSCSESEGFVYSNLSTNKISFKAIATESWTNGTSNNTSQDSKTTRSVLQSNENSPLIVKSNLHTPLYLHPVTQIGIHIQSANDKPMTKSGARIIDESTETVVPTRGSPYTSSNMVNSFGVLAYRTPSTATDLSGASPDFINNQEVSLAGGMWKTGTDYFWPDNGDKLSFFSYTPFGNSNVTVAGASSSGTPSVTYTANTDVPSQPDLMTSNSINQTRSKSSTNVGVNMTFSHALTAITFAVGKDMVPGVFKRISIKNAITTATYNLSTNTWNTSSGTSTGNISINLNGTTGVTIDGTSDVALTSGTNTMMMIPQSFASGSTAVIEVVFNNGNGDKTLTASLAGTTWAAGTSIIYKLSTSSVNTMTLGTISYPSSWGGVATPTTSFSTGNEIGLYVVDQNNNIKNSNVKATYNGSSWVLSTGLLFSPQYKYFAYYPYQSGYTSSSVLPSATSSDVFFSNVISGWTVTSDQNTANKFNSNDLQVSMGTISSTASSITFNMAHKMGLAVITLGSKSVPTTRTYTGGNSTYSDSSDKTTVTASSNFSGNQPLLYNNKYYYISKAGTSTTFNSITADNDAWSAPLSATIPSGGSSALTVTNTNRSFYKFIANFNYTGDVQSFTVPLYGTSKFECWGASGGDMTYVGGNGGYTVGSLSLNSGNVFYAYVGQSNGGYNGGGVSYQPTIGGSGGGGTDIRLVNGNWNDFNSLKSRIMVAGGGGGACLRGEGYGDGNGGYGGGLTGGTGQSINHTQAYGYSILTGGSQTSGGVASWVDLGQGVWSNGYVFQSNAGQFGYATTASNGANSINTQAGGGGGYYAGAGGGHSGAGGGSSFVSGYTGCNAIYSSSTASDIRSTGTPNHYSLYVFSGPNMIAGNASMPSPGGTTETGHDGNGYARITFIP